MGRRKGSKNKKRKGTTSSSSTQNTFMTEFLGGLTVVLGLALIVIFKFDNMGVLSQGINSVFTGLLGEMRMILPVICFYVGGATIIASKKTSLSELTSDEWVELGMLEKELERVCKKIFNIVFCLGIIGLLIYYIDL